jgi:hypothetical protein
MGEQPIRARDEQEIQPDPVIDAFKHDVDRTLIREQLKRSIDERVRNMIAALRLVEKLREAHQRQRRT